MYQERGKIILDDTWFTMQRTDKYTWERENLRDKASMNYVLIERMTQKCECDR